MQKQIIKSMSVLVGTVLFDFLFFKQFIGLNLLLISIFFEGTLFYFYRENFSNRNVQAVALGTFILALCIVFNNSKIAEVSYLLSFSFLVGLTQLPELRFLFFGSLLFAGNFLEVPKHFANSLTDLPIIGKNLRWRNYFLPVFMSLIIGSVFFFIYFLSNPRFAEVAANFFEALARIFSFRFDIGHIIFFGVCFFITGATIWQNSLFNFSKLENSFSDDFTLSNIIDETASNAQKEISDNGNRFGIVLLATINLLLLLNNLTDIPFVWLNLHTGFSPTEMKSFVHEGTYLLIFGIFLAIIILLWLFKRSYSGDWKLTEGQMIEPKKQSPKSNTLILLAIIWLAQNAFLALSVGIRNAHYINAFGLAYKRIGVVFFLILVLCCLWFLYEKIKNSETFYRFVSRNSWALYIILVAASCISWDTFITQYNIKHTDSKNLDVRFLLNDVSDKNTYQLVENKNYLLEAASKSEVSLGDEIIYHREPDKKLLEKEFDERVYAKMKRVIHRLGHNDWRSWNYPDYVNQQFLEKFGK